MTISTKVLTEELQKISQGIDFNGMLDTTSDITTDLEAAGKSLIGNFSGQIKGGIEGLAPQLTTLADQAKTSLEPVMAKVTKDMPGATKHLVEKMEASGITRIAELSFDSDELMTEIFPAAQTALASADTMLNSIIADGTASSMAASLESVTGKAINEFEPMMKELTDIEFSDDILDKVTALKENEGVKKMTDQLGNLSKSFASATGPFESGNLLKDVVENKSYQVTNTLRNIIGTGNIVEGDLTNIAQDLMSGNKATAIGNALGSVAIPENLLSAVSDAGIPLPLKSEVDVTKFVQKIKFELPDIAGTAEVLQYEKLLSDARIAVDDIKANVTSSISDESLPSDKRNTKASDLAKPNVFKTIRSQHELNKLFSTCNREVSTLVIHSTGHNRDAAFVGAAEINQTYVSKGLKQLPYHFIIKRDGKLQTGAPIHIETPHTLSEFRPLSIGLGIVSGSVPEVGEPTDLTKLQHQKMMIFIHSFYQVFGAGADIFGQRDLDADGESHSPGFEVSDILEKMGKENTCVPLVDKKFLTGVEIIDRAIAEYEGTRE